MNALAEIRTRFANALESIVDSPTELLGMIRPAKDATFGDYQANIAMPLGKKLGKPPRDVATEIVNCLLYTSPSPRDQRGSRMPSSA